MDKFIGCGCPMFSEDSICLVQNTILLSFLKDLFLEDLFLNYYEDLVLVEGVGFLYEPEGRLRIFSDCLPAFFGEDFYSFSL